MSRSTNEYLTNPASKVLEWSGSEGHFSWWDKTAKERVIEPFPVRLIVLDTLHSVGGYSNQDESRFYSNECRKVTDTFVVRCKKHIVIQGPLADVKKVTGVKYKQAVYFAYRPDKDANLRIAKMELSGAAITPWIDFCQNLSGGRLYKGFVKVGEAVQNTKGKVTYFSPVFEFMPVLDTDEKAVKVLAEADALDKFLQMSYLDPYLKRGGIHPLDDGGPDKEAVGASFPPSDEEAPPEQRADAGMYISDDDVPF